MSHLTSLPFKDRNKLFPGLFHLLKRLGEIMSAKQSVSLKSSLLHFDSKVKMNQKQRWGMKANVCDSTEKGNLSRVNDSTWMGDGHRGLWLHTVKRNRGLCLHRNGYEGSYLWFHGDWGMETNNSDFTEMEADVYDFTEMGDCMLMSVTSLSWWWTQNPWFLRGRGWRQMSMTSQS